MADVGSLDALGLDLMREVSDAMALEDLPDGGVKVRTRFALGDAE